MPKAITLTQSPGKPGSVYHSLTLTNTPTPPDPLPTSTTLLLRILSTSLNHRDLFIRQSLYPGVAFNNVPLLSDACALVLSTGSSPSALQWQGKRIVLNPGSGWREDGDGPEQEGGYEYRILGGTKSNPDGTLQELMLVEADQVEEAPSHLTDAEAAALPLTGLTAWRALVAKVGEANLRAGKRLLVTGIGGGVAVMALRFAVAMGVEVWVTSARQEKIETAVELGAKGGVSYREEGWEKKLLGLVGEEAGPMAFFDAIVDGAGGDIVEKACKILKPGGVICSYGMTLGPKMPFLMQAVMKNIEIKGSTMGSRKEFKDMVDFVRRKEVRPVVSRTVQGIENIEGIDSLFEEMKQGSQFGKLVIEIAKEAGSSSKL